MKWITEVSRFVSQHGLDTVPFSTESKLAPKSTQPIQYALQTISPQVKQLGHEADHSPLASASVFMTECLIMQLYPYPRMVFYQLFILQKECVPS
jgi:hypothetical protein